MLFIFSRSVPFATLLLPRFVVSQYGRMGSPNTVVHPMTLLMLGVKGTGSCHRGVFRKNSGILSVVLIRLRHV